MSLANLLVFALGQVEQTAGRLELAAIERIARGQLIHAGRVEHAHGAAHDATARNSRRMRRT